VWLVYHGEAARTAQWTLLHELRAADVAADMDHSGRSVKAQFKLLDREGAKWAVTVGDTELANGTVVLKDLTSGEQTTLPKDQLIERLRTPAAAR
jgi:histidyl-tRNA synthetase